MSSLIIGHKALKPADLDRFFDAVERLSDGAGRLALCLLGADPPADRRQQIRLLYDLARAQEISFFNLADKSGNIDAHRASCNTWSILALETALRFEHCPRRGVAEGDLVHVVAPLRWVLGRHVLGRYLHSHFGGDRCRAKSGKFHFRIVHDVLFLVAHFAGSFSGARAPSPCASSSSIRISR